MEEKRNKHEVDDIEMLIDLIPRATSLHTHLDNSISIPLTSANAELSFKDGLPIDATTFRRVNYHGISDRTFLPDKQYANYMKSSILPSTDLPITLNETNHLSLPSYDFDQFSVEITCRENTDSQKLDDGMTELNGYSWQALAHQMNFPRVISPFSAPGIAVAAVPYTQHYLPSIQHSSRQCCTPWFHIEEEDLLGENGNATNGLNTWDIKQSYTDLPLSKYDHFGQESFKNYDMFSRGLTCSGSTFTRSSPCCFHAQGFCGRGASCPFVHGQDMFCPSQPRPALSAPKNSLNLTKTIKFNSVQEDELPKYTRADGGVPSNGHGHLNAHIQSVGSFLLDGRNVWDQSADSKGGRHDNMWSQLQKSDSVDDISGRIYYMAKDQYGCRILQRKLTQCTAEDVEKIFLEIVGHIAELMMHPFGNYLIQKLLQVCDENQLTQIVYAVTTKSGELGKISCNKQGTRVVQELIKSIKSSEQASRIISYLKPDILKLIKHANGYHIAKHCLEYLIPGYIEFIVEAAAAHCVELATNRYGCCVLKDCLNHSDGELRRQLIYEITSNALIMSQDPFGNYVVQHVVELEISWATAEMLKQLDGNYAHLSKQKFGSNVVEKCLKHAGEEHLPRIIQEFIDYSQFDLIMQDQFGNFVIQTALNQSKGSLHAALMEAIRPHIWTLRASPYGRKVLSCCGSKKQAILPSPSSSANARSSPSS